MHDISRLPKAQRMLLVEHIIRSIRYEEQPTLEKAEIVNSRQKDIFAEVRGIWADRDIDGKTLRNQAWGIDE